MNKTMALLSIKALSLLLLSIAMTSCIKRGKGFLLGQLKTSVQIPEQNYICPDITVWIHGTRLTPRAVAPLFFYSIPGLQSAQKYDTKYHARKIANNLIAADPETFTLEHFYFFGWTGKLSFNARKQAAQDLHNELQNLKKKYYDLYHAYPKIRIITHSHGGNVALNLAGLENKEKLSIAELILLACPVQTQTMHFIQDPCFEKVCSFYSESDIMQVIDPQGLYKNKVPHTSLFSKRRFPDQKNLIQVKTCGKNRGLSHIEFLMHTFTQQLPLVLNTLKHSNSEERHQALHVYKKKIVHEKIINDFSLEIAQAHK